jgi:ADP-heptose:LPS heptosyltransferase
VARSKFLIIRRDNIGDLVCTTPLVAALRKRYPEAWIGALVNGYNAPVLAGNPDFDAIYAYEKAKHREPGQSLLGVYAQRLRLLLSVRREGIDYAILAAPGWQPRSLALARLAGARQIVGFVPADGTRPSAARHITHPVPYAHESPLHETEDVFRLLAPLGIDGTPPATKVVARACSREEPPGTLLVGVHISARKPSQRWPIERFAALMRALHAEHHARFRLFWAPGSAHNPKHPGDDEKARTLLDDVRELPVTPHATHELSALIDGLAACDVVVCGDGGAMHIAAGLGKPIVCLFGKSEANRWHPWAVPYVLLQHPSLDVAAITVAEAQSGFRALLADRSVRTPESSA